MILLPIAVIWGGYALLWYGFALLKGPGIGVLDVVLPARSGKMDDAVVQWRMDKGFPAREQWGGGDFPSSSPPPGVSGGGTRNAPAPGVSDGSGPAPGVFGR